MRTTTSLDKNESNKEVDVKRYKELYLTTSHPYIIFSICLCVIFQASPR